MANRAERRRQMRAHAASEQMKTLQPQVEMSKDELKRIERELKDIQEGSAGFSGIMAANQEKFRRKMEVREQVRKIIEHNGITAQDLDNAREEGRQEGFRQAAEPIIKSVTRGSSLRCMMNLVSGKTGLSGPSRPWTRRSFGRSIIRSCAMKCWQRPGLNCCLMNRLNECRR